MIPAEDLYRVAVTHLVQTADSSCPGWRSEVDRRLEHSRGAFRKSLERGTLRLRDFIIALGILQKRPSAFFLELEDYSPLDPSESSLLEELKSYALQRKNKTKKFSELVDGLAINFEHFDSPQSTKPLIQSIRCLQNSPKEAAAVIESSISLLKDRNLESSLTAPILFEWASLQRRINDFDSSLVCLLWVLENAQQQECSHLVGETYLRLGEVVLRIFSKPTLSLYLADRAYLIFTGLGIDNPIGQSLVVRSCYLNLAGRPTEALSSVNLALRFLAPGDRYQGSAQQFLGFLHYQAENYDIAERHISAAEELANGDNFLLGMTLWVKAQILDRTHAPGPEEVFRQSKDLLLSRGCIVQAVLVSLDLAEYFLRRNQPGLALEATKDMLPLIEPLKPLQAVQTAILHLVRSALENQAALTQDAIRQTARTIRARAAL